jgi:hypothetical protein
MSSVSSLKWEIGSWPQYWRALYTEEKKTGLYEKMDLLKKMMVIL